MRSFGNWPCPSEGRRGGTRRINPIPRFPSLPLLLLLKSPMLFSWVSKSRPLLSLSSLENKLLIDHGYLLKWTSSLFPSYASYKQDELGRKSVRSEGVSGRFQNILSNGYIPCKYFYAQSSSGTYAQSRSCYTNSFSQIESNSLLNADRAASDNDSITKYAATIQEILKSHESTSELESALNRFVPSLGEDLVVQVLRRHRSDWKLALSFFNWASTQQGYAYGSRALNEMLDILGRMKQIKLMRQMFDEIPKERGTSIINEKTFSILLNRYAGAHKVQEAIDMFYKRKDYGFELDMVAFQTLLMSLCRYKHVEEAEALFLKKQNEFPPVIRSRNIILNGWCVLGSLRDAKRFWNDIISSKCQPDVVTYGIFINSLAKAGKLGSAVKLFTSMQEKGSQPDVTICNCIIDALCFKKRIPEALEIFGEMGEPGCLPDVATYNSLIKHLCKIRRMEKVYELLDEMEQKGCLPNTRTYSYILKMTKKPEEVTDLLYRMERTGCKIDGDTYNLILNLYVQWKYQSGIRYLWAEMERSGLGPDQRSYTIMIHGLHRQGKLDEALQFYSKMRSKGMIPEPRTRILIKAIFLKREKGSDTSHDSSSTV
ncbi:putative pentatricopeptide repeat-containing protein At3g15200 [Phoenix dactylifera]|uniref:Pentatricopeptide repeat-containing protein At3g15200 n=1 Tax=Phoenix dactylifera TaxID=42345 RepID=A0A8B7BQH9_PHODC|nr:putative pentatricopeptide repeat-containing protein At3g15200 [Phoenix dactylifera]